MTFRVGQKVVCINSFTWAEHFGLTLPSEGRVYTIREFEDRGEGPSLRLVEIANIPRMHANGIFAETSFAVECFRPVVERKTDISIFTAMLTPSKVGA